MRFWKSVNLIFRSSHIIFEHLALCSIASDYINSGYTNSIEPTFLLTPKDPWLALHQNEVLHLNTPT